MTVNLGSQHANHYLSRLGFHTDHDVDLPVVDKVQWICGEMARLSLADAQDIYQQNLREIEHNYQNFYSQHLIKLFADYLRDRLAVA